MNIRSLITILCLCTLLLSACAPAGTAVPGYQTPQPTLAASPSSPEVPTQADALPQTLPLDIDSVPYEGLLAVADEAGIYVYQMPADGSEPALRWSAAIPGGARKLAFSSGGGLLAVAGSELLTVWDVESGQARFALALPDQASGENLDPFHLSLTALAISPDEKTLASVNGRGDIVLRDAASGAWLNTIPTGGGSDPAGLSFSPDGKYLASATGRFLFVWDLAAGQRLWARQPQLGDWFQNSYRLAFSPDGRTLVNIGDSVMVWDTAAGNLIRHIEGASGSGVAFSPDGKSLALATSSGLSLMDAAAGEQEAVYLTERSLSKVEYVTGDLIAVHDFTHPVTLVDVDGGDIVAVVETSIRPDEKDIKIATGPEVQRPAPTAAPQIAMPAFQHRSIQVESVSTDQSTLALDLAFTDDAFLRIATDLGVFSLSTASDDRPTGDLVWDEQPSRVFLSPDGTRAGALRLVPEGLEIKLWEVSSGSLLRTIVSDPLDGIGAVGFSPDGSRVAIKTGEDVLEVQDVPAGETLFRWQDPSTQYVSYDDVVFSPDGGAISAGSRGTFTIWDLENSALFSTTGGCRSNVICDQAYSPDGQWLAVLCAPQETDLGFFVLLRSEEHQVVTFWDEVGQLQSAVFSPDGKYLVMGTKTGSILFFDMLEVSPAGYPAVKQIGELKEHNAPVFRLAYSPDGRFLASASRDGQVILWEVED